VKIAIKKDKNSTPEEKVKILYVCERPYNLFRTLLKAVKCFDDNDKPDILITNYTKGMCDMCNELINSKMFDNVYYFDGYKFKTFIRSIKGMNRFAVEKISDIKDHIISFFYLIGGFFNYIKAQQMAKKITLPEGLDLDKYDEISINDLTSTINFYLYRRKNKNLIYVEHGKNALSGKYLKVLNLHKILTKLRIIPGIRGSNQYVKAIEVSKNKNLISDTKGKEIRELSIDKLVNDLTTEQGEFIYQLYAKSYNFNFPETSIIDMFMTTPIDGETSDNIYISVCEEVIKEFMSGSDIILIKPHPDDRTNYTPIINKNKRCTIIPPYISAEIFTLSTSIKIRKLINIDSSASGYFKSVDEDITLGYKYLYEKGFSYTDNP